MLEKLDLKLSLEKASYKAELNKLMPQLRWLQSSCWQYKLPVIIVLEGWAAAGKGIIVKKIVKYMDPRGFTLHPILPPTNSEEEYPFLWRFWQKLPPIGKFSLFYHSWYINVLEARLFNNLPPSQVSWRMNDINAFESQLIDGGVTIIKFWIHLSHEELKHRLKKYANDKLQGWRIRKEDWQQAQNYDKYLELVEDMLVNTHTKAAPWQLIEGDCKYWARIKVVSELVIRITEALQQHKIGLVEKEKVKTTPNLSLDSDFIKDDFPKLPSFLDQVNLNLSLEETKYHHRLSLAQVKLRQIQLKIHQAKIPVLILFEGWDAAGKGGAIKHLTRILDPRSYQVHPFGAPNEEEKKYHYLWRFWQKLPPKGTIGIFDRTWYGRVLVERVEGLATQEEWMRAYEEINQFEAQLIHEGYLIVKFWLHISQEEQLERFQNRAKDPLKSYKLTEEDWRNREKWDKYFIAINQAIARTNTPQAPWNLVPGNDKYLARVYVIETVIDAIKKALKKKNHKN